MGIFNELEKLTAKTGNVVGSVIQDLSAKTTGWGEKADVLVEAGLEKVKEAAKKTEKDSTDVPTETPAEAPASDSTAETKPEAPKPAPAPKA